MAWYDFLSLPLQRAPQSYNVLSEDEDKLLEEAEETAQLTTHQQLLDLQRANRTLKRLLRLVIILFVTFLTMLLFQSSNRNTLLIPQILKTPVPQMSLILQTFHHSPIYSSPPSRESDLAWNNLLPRDCGFIYVSNTSLYNLPPGEPTPKGEICSITLFHQLHCLAQLRKHYWLLINGIRNKEPWLEEMVEESMGQGEEHVKHCFDYLRQGVQCNADMSLEWPREEEEGKRRFRVDGWGVQHECRNWDEVVRFMGENYFDGSIEGNIDA